jgi:hypothetical protein
MTKVAVAQKIAQPPRRETSKNGCATKTTGLKPGHYKIKKSTQPWMATLLKNTD